MAQRSDLQCDVEKIAYDFERRVGTLHMAPDNCCDMAGCLEFFQKIDKDVKRIETYSGSKPDTLYMLSGNAWNAISPSE